MYHKKPTELPLIKKAIFIKSFLKFKDYVDQGFPEIVFLGRSNVGKSSLINSLLQKKQLAKTSNTPGRTQTINIFTVNDRWTFIDLPGFGYAKASKSTQHKWHKLIEPYLSKSNRISLLCYLFDIRRDPTQEDRDIFNWLLSYNLPLTLILTKMDKVSKNELIKRNKAIASAFSIHPDDCLGYSSLKKKGIAELWTVIQEVVE